MWVMELPELIGDPECIAEANMKRKLLLERHRQTVESIKTYAEAGMLASQTAIDMGLLQITDAIEERIVGHTDADFFLKRIHKGYKDITIDPIYNALIDAWDKISSEATSYAKQRTQG